MKRYIAKTGLFLLLLAATVSAGSFLVIMDASTSMDDYLDSGETKLEAAKAAAIDFIDASQGDQFAVMKFHTCDDGGNPQTGDIRVIRELTSNKQELRSSINGIGTGDWTPIAEAIAEGREYVKSEMGGKGTIILLTDGEENCGGDPVLEAQKTTDEGIAVINVISYSLADDPAAKAQHQQIAAAGGGKYYTAENKDELKQAFQKIEQDQGGGSVCCLPAFGLLFIAGAAFVRHREMRA
ncbi:MAG: VWA domain-containing protein [Candidatus Burarchaeum sp.]|nr:VWA domain-containing protein [Candidatus Burarchaeum sp.]MDO8339495.1 VWA domain-containing protein [Candidatus Burarchaeum sp.]